MAVINSVQIGSTIYDLRDTSKVEKNNTITGATKCKITYDAKGLVTAGANLTATDIPNLSADKINSGTLGIARIPTGDSTSTSADLVVKCNDSRLSDSRPASDVSAWAKASTKPSYNFGEIGAGVATIGDGTNRLMFRTNSGYVNGVYYSTPGNEALIFATKNPVTSWMFATVSDPTAGTSWQNLTPALQIKKQSVAINKLIGNNVDPTYNLDINGTLNATTIYQNGTALATVATSGSYSDLNNKPTIETYHAGTGITLEAHISHDNEYYINLDTDYIDGTLDEDDNKLATQSTVAASVGGRISSIAESTVNGKIKFTKDGSTYTEVAVHGLGSNAFNSTTIPTTYLKSASVSGNTLTLTKQDNTTVTFTPSGGGSTLYRHNIEFVFKGGTSSSGYTYTHFYAYTINSTSTAYTSSTFFSNITTLFKKTVLCGGLYDYSSQEDYGYDGISTLWQPNYSKSGNLNGVYIKYALEGSSTWTTSTYLTSSTTVYSFTDTVETL